MAEATYWLVYGTENKKENNFENDFFELMNNSFFFPKDHGECKKPQRHKDIKLMTNDKRGYLVSGPSINNEMIFRKSTYNWVE